VSGEASQIPDPPSRPLTQRLLDILVWGGIAALLLASVGPVQLSRLPLLFSKSSNMQEFVTGFIHPDYGEWRTYVSAMWMTVEIALWGTLLAIVVALPLGLLAAKNVTPPWIRHPVRRLLDLMRALPVLVIGIMFIVAVGVGPLPGVLALAINTGGVLGKLFSEAVETVDPRPVEGVRATGATPLQQIIWGVLPQVAPLWTSYALYRFESSARDATVLGLIGAGGIGQLIMDSLNGFKFDETAMIVIVIIVAVSLIDLLSQVMRSRLI
jgi:phosphonate transport system permease protein